MSDWGDTAGDAAADIHAAFATATITLQPVTGSPIANITAVEVDNPGDDPFGDGRSVRQRGYEIQKSDVPAKPVNGTIVVHGSKQRRVVEVRDVADAGAWLLMTEAK